VTTNVGTGPVAKLERIGDANAFEFAFDPSLLDGLASIYQNVVAPRFDINKLRAGGGHAELQASRLRFDITSFGNLLAWVSAAEIGTHREFLNVFHRLGLADAVTPLVDWQDRIVMYQGFYVVSHGVEDPTWHVDYHEGANAYTLLTPLFELEAGLGHLLHADGQQIKRHEYRYGAGVVLGERFLHSTEPHPAGKRPRVLVSMTFGTDRMAHWPVLEKTVGGQSPFVVLPCGHQRGTCICTWQFRPTY
jgi:hypothetical protein